MSAAVSGPGHGPWSLASRRGGGDAGWRVDRKPGPAGPGLMEWSRTFQNLPEEPTCPGGRWATPGLVCCLGPWTSGEHLPPPQPPSTPASCPVFASTSQHLWLPGEKGRLVLYRTHLWGAFSRRHRPAALTSTVLRSAPRGRGWGRSEHRAVSKSPGRCALTGDPGHDSETLKHPAPPGASASAIGGPGVATGWAPPCGGCTCPLPARPEAHPWLDAGHETPVVLAGLTEVAPGARPGAGAAGPSPEEGSAEAGRG